MTQPMDPNFNERRYMKEADFLDRLRDHVNRPVIRAVVAEDMGMTLPQFDQKIARARRRGRLLPGRIGNVFTVEFPRECP